MSTDHPLRFGTDGLRGHAGEPPMDPESLRRVGSALGVPLGLALAYALVFVINVRSFGWTLQYDPSPGLLLQALVISVIAALAAAVIPAVASARAPVDQLLRSR